MYSVWGGGWVPGEGEGGAGGGGERGLGGGDYAYCGKEQPNIANLPKHAVHGRDSTKPPAQVLPRTASLKPTLVLCTCLATMLYRCCVLL